MNYQSKNKQVDAYQLEDFNIAGTLPPRWVIAQILDGTITVVPNTRSLKFGSYLVTIGDWIIKTAGGQIFALSDTDFRDQYELIP